MGLTSQESSWRETRPFRKTAGFERTEKVPHGLGRGPEPVMTPHSPGPRWFEEQSLPSALYSHCVSSELVCI